MENKLNLFQKIQAVSMDIMIIEKNMIVGSGSYSYKAVSDTDVILEVKKSEAKHGILSVPISSKVIKTDILKVLKNGNESYTFSDLLEVTVMLVDLDDIKSTLTITCSGRGIDTNDKGIGKGNTLARKYALLNVYKIATGEDPDANKSEKITAPKTVDEKRVAVLNRLSTDGDLCTKVLGHFGVETKEDLTDKDIKNLFQTWTTKGVL